MNAMTHGLTAQPEMLPISITTQIDATHSEWAAFYKPPTPLERELLEQMGTASVQRKRSVGYYCGEVDAAEANALKEFDEDREDEVAASVDLLETDPRAALRRLRRSSYGCQYLIERWDRLAFMMSIVDVCGWTFKDQREMVQLQGYSADSRRLGESHDARVTMMIFKELYPDVADPAAEPEKWDCREVLLERWYASEGMSKPPGAEEECFGWTKDPEKGRNWLMAKARGQLAELKLREEFLRVNHDEPARALAVPRALCPGGAQGANFLRYERQHLQAFHKAYAQFVKGREQANKTGLLPGMLAEGVAERLPPMAEELDPSSPRRTTLADLEPDRCGLGHLEGAAEEPARNEANLAGEATVSPAPATTPVIAASRDQGVGDGRSEAAGSVGVAPGSPRPPDA